MNKLRIGKVGKRVFTLPLDVAGEAVAVLAKRGAGKTNTAGVLVEEMHRAGIQVVILDPVGAWWGLRTAADGKSAGLSIPILGGQHGDVPLEETAGALVADVVVDTGSSMLLDLSDFPTKAAMNRFSTAFAKRLYFRKGRARSPLHVVLEEADQFCPQSKGRGEEQLVGAFESMVRLGRGRGIGITMVTQRSAKLNKDILTQADVLIAMRTTGPHDRAAIKAWVSAQANEDADVVGTLHELKTGEAWIWNPERDLLSRVQIRLRDTFDSSATPKAGERRTEPTAAAAIDLAALGEQIADTAEKAKANDPAELKRTISHLQAEIRKAEKRDVDPEMIAAAEERGRSRAWRDIKKVTDEIRRRAAAIADATRTATESACEIIAATDNFSAIDDRDVAARPRRAEPAARVAAARPVRRVPASTPPNGDATITAPQQRILNTLAELESIGISGPDKKVLAALAGVSAKSSAYANNLGHLRSQVGAIDYPAGGCVALTDTGRGIAEPQDIQSLEELHAGFRKFLTLPQQRIFNELAERFPDDVDKAELADVVEASIRSSAYANNLGRLRTMGLIDYRRPGRVAATALLFPEGLY